MSAAHELYESPMKIVYLMRSDTWRTQEEMIRLELNLVAPYSRDEKTGRYLASGGAILVVATFEGRKWKRHTYDVTLKKPFSEASSLDDVTTGTLLQETCFDGEKSYWNLHISEDPRIRMRRPILVYGGPKSDTFDIRTLPGWFQKEDRDAATTGSVMLDENTARFVKTSGRTMRTWTFLLCPYMQVVRHETAYRNDEGREIPTLIVETKNHKVFPSGVTFPTDLSYAAFFKDGGPKLQVFFKVLSVEAPASLDPSVFSPTILEGQKLQQMQERPDSARRAQR
jgi:hypothetical protein